MARALVVSCQYGNFEDLRLNGCFYDSERFVNQLKKMDPNMKIVIMRDDYPKSSGLFPTSDNIKRKLNELCTSKSEKLFFYYSGHGSYKDDENNDEMQQGRNSYINFMRNSLGKDSCLVSNEIKEVGLVSDDDLNLELRSLKSNQTLYSFMDCCHSGSILDLYCTAVGDYTKKFNYKTPRELIREGKRKCKINKSFYKSKSEEIKGTVILISGTRDKDYSYESNIGGQPQGHFTTALVKALDLGFYKKSLRVFYSSLIVLIDDKDQIPVLSMSKNLNLRRTKISNLNTRSKLSRRDKLLLLMR